MARDREIGEATKEVSVSSPDRNNSDEKEGGRVERRQFEDFLQNERDKTS